MVDYIIQKNGNNRYDYLLIFYISLLVFGMYGGALQPIRIFIILFAPFTILFYLKDHTIRTKYLYEIFTFIFWIYYACITLIWVIDISSAIKEIFYLTINFIGVLLLFHLSTKSNNPIRSVIKGWISFILLTLPIALAEIIFDVHLSVAVMDADSTIGVIGIVWKYASVTFGNYNGYNQLIVYALPFVISSLFLYTEKSKALFIWSIIILCALIILSNASRGSFLCLTIALIVFFYYTRKQKVNKLGLFLFISSIAIGVAFFAGKIFLLFLYRTQQLGLTKDTSRLDIILAGMQKLKEHYFLGVGAGNFQINLKYINNLLTAAPHNLLFEILVEYGPFITIIFIIIFTRIIAKARKNPNFIAKYIVFAMLLCAPFAFVIDSSYISGVPVWILIASLVIVSDKQYYSDEKFIPI